MSKHRHLLGLEGLSRLDLERLIDRAHEYREGRVGGRHLLGRVVANVFYEPSTRTRSSFEVAAAGLGAHVLNWSVSGSSSTSTMWCGAGIASLSERLSYHRQRARERRNQPDRECP